MAAVNIRISHDDDFVVADFLDIEGPLDVAFSDACADGGDHRLDLFVL